VKVTLVPSSLSTTADNACQYLSSYIVNGSLAFDAGSLGFYQTPAEQASIRHVILSHSHMDHVASLPIFLENVAGLTPAPVALYASEAVQHSLRLDLFNGRVWPDFLNLTHNKMPFVTVHTIASGGSFELEGLRITPVRVDHVVPTLGLILEGPTSAVVISADTGPTEELWQRAKKIPNLKAVFLEVTFPDAMTRQAEISKHLTPASFVNEVKKLALPVPFYAVHLKAQFREQVTRELLEYGLANVAIAEFGREYEF
jgi:ribonuclease BN (tRNA processing enzyme)